MDIMPPREKYKQKGIAGLTEKDLVGILVGSGTKGNSYDVISKKILKELEKSFDDNQLNESLSLVKIDGVGAVTELRVLAGVELGKRLIENNNENEFEYIYTTESSLKHFLDIQNKKREYVKALYLDARYKLLKSEVLAIGTVSRVGILPRDVIIPGLEANAAYIILAHNHPSGNPEPSQSDVLLTKRLKESCELVGITLVDHVIVSNSGKWTSVCVN